LLSCYVKLCNSFPELIPKIQGIFRRFTAHADEELQQRACEYSTIIGSERKLLEDVFELMPAFENTKDLQTMVKVRTKKSKIAAGEAKEEDDDEEEDVDEADEDEEEDEDLDFPDQSEETFKDLIRTPTGSGFLYKSESLQIGVKMLFAQDTNSFKLKIFYGNKSSFPLENLTVSVAKPAEVMIQVRPNEPFAVGPKEQKSQFVKAVCARGFEDPTVMTITCTVDGEQQSFEIKMPILINQFISPYPCDAAKFKQSWGSLKAEAREVVPLKGVDGKTVVESVASIFHMHKVEMAASAVPLVGVFNTTTSKLPVMASVAVKGNQCQFIARSNDPSVSKALLASFKLMFS